MAITKRTRFEVLKRDNHTCRYCHATDTQLTIDHVVPTALGGSDDPANLVAACKDCNAGKAASNPDAPLVAAVADDALRWAAAMRQASMNWLADRDAGAEYGDAVARAWDSNNEMYRFGRAWLDDDWVDTAERWRATGIPAQLVVDAIGIAMRRRNVVPRDVWRYACGIVWTKLTELQEDAQATLRETQRPDGEATDTPDYQRGWKQGLDNAFLVPSMNYGNLMFRRLSKVVDGPNPWNLQRSLDEAS